MVAPIKERTLAAESLAPSEPLAPQIVRILARRIVTNALAPGERLSENEISSSLGVSRQPVREAFIRLGESGLVRALPQRGTEVTKIDIHSVNSGRFLREAVEVAVIGEAARHGAASTVDQMDRVLEAQGLAIKAVDHVGFLALDDDLHALFARSIGREGVWRLMQHVKLQMDRVRYLSLPDATPGDLLLKQHAAIIAAVRAHNPARAEAAMREHLSEVLSSLPRLVKKMPHYFDR
jgi:GntR family transcriptional regulator, rspAB operon transcriptional repressor